MARKTALEEIMEYILSSRASYASCDVYELFREEVMDDTGCPKGGCEECRKQALSAFEKILARDYVRRDQR